MARKMNMAAVIAAIKSVKTPVGLKKGLIKKYGHLLEKSKMPMEALATTMRPNPKKKMTALDKQSKRVDRAFGKAEKKLRSSLLVAKGYHVTDAGKPYRTKPNPHTSWKAGDVLQMMGGSGIQNKFEIISKHKNGFIIRNESTRKEMVLDPPYFKYFKKSSRGAHSNPRKKKLRYSNPMDPVTRKAYKKLRRVRRKHKPRPKDRQGITPNGIKINADMSYREGLISGPERDQAVKRYQQKMTGELTRGGYLVGNADIYVTEGPKGTYTVDYPAKRYTGRIKGADKTRSFLKPAKSMGLKISWA